MKMKLLSPIRLYTVLIFLIALFVTGCKPDAPQPTEVTNFVAFGKNYTANHCPIYINNRKYIFYSLTKSGSDTPTIGLLPDVAQDAKLAYFGPPMEEIFEQVWVRKGEQGNK